MKTKLSLIVSVALINVLLCAVSLAQDKKVPEVETFPALPKSYSKEAPKTGLGASTSNVVLISPRGAFGLAFSSTTETGAVFEYANKGFVTKLKYLGIQDDFLYFAVQGWQVVVAIRNHATGGTHDVYFFVNGGSTPIFFVKGLAFPPA